VRALGAGRAVAYGARSPEIRLDYRGMMRVAGGVDSWSMAWRPGRWPRRWTGSARCCRPGGKALVRFAGDTR